MDHECVILPPSEPAVGTNQLLERGNLGENWVERSEQDDVSDMILLVEGDNVGPRQRSVEFDGITPTSVGDHSIDDFSPSVISVCEQRSVALFCHDEPDVWVGGQPLEQSGELLAELFVIDSTG